MNDLGHYFTCPRTAERSLGAIRAGLPFTQARTINLTDYDIYDQASIRWHSRGTTKTHSCSRIPQRGIEFGGYPNDGNFSWSVALVNGNNNTPAMRNSKDVYVRVSQRFNLERDPSVRKEVQAAGPTGPRDHTSTPSWRVLLLRPQCAQHGWQSLFPGLGTIQEPFYRAGGDFRFKYRNFELYGLGMYGHDTNVIPNAAEHGFQLATPVTFTGGFA